MIPLLLSKLRPHLGNLNEILQYYGVSIVVTVDAESEEVIIEEGKALIFIDDSQKWFGKKD